MKKLLKFLTAGALSLASFGTLAAVPSFASSISGVSIGGSAANDYFVYDANSVNTFVVPSTLVNAQKVLDGNAISPTGNVELAASSEKAGFDFTKNTSLSGTIGGKSITLSSLTSSDWAAVGTIWFKAALTANGYGAVVSNSFLYNTVWSKFTTGSGQQRFSDPNISYVNQDDTNGVISIGLAGHYDATSLLFGSLNESERNLINALRDSSKVGTAIQASELVKYTYEGQSSYLYSFYATSSGLVAKDDKVSHTGNYEVTFQGAKPVPVPAAFVGIAMTGAMGAGMLKRRKVASKV